MEQRCGDIRVVCISDTHTKAHELKLPAGDVLIHAGDFTSSGLPQEVAGFNDFLRQTRFEKKIVIAGNHDLTFDLAHYDKDLARAFHKNINPPVDAVKTKALLKDCIYLENESCDMFGYNVYGSPFTPTFFNWAFNLDIGLPLQSAWSQIPSDTDILITHGPPRGILDRCSDGVLAGCPDLTSIVLERIKPMFHIFGHIHEAYGQKTIDGTTFINASSLNENYRSGAQPPIVFTLPFRSDCQELLVAARGNPQPKKVSKCTIT